jgi:hypothetical protein
MKYTVLVTTMSVCYDIFGYYNAWQISRPQAMALALLTFTVIVWIYEYIFIAHVYHNNERVLLSYIRENEFQNQNKIRPFSQCGHLQP